MIKKIVISAVSLFTVVVLAACGSGSTATSGLSGEVRVDGSSTVYPLTALAAEEFQATHQNVNVTVGSSGTGGGFEKFCRGETDANDASRQIKDEEIAACKANGIEYGELLVAMDALTVVVNKENTWAKCLTVEQLNKIWAAGSTVNNWNQVDPTFPNEPIKLFGPGTDSGTFDYFTAVINGEEGSSRTDFTPSEDDNVIVQGVEGSKGGLGYFGFTYYEENADRLNAVAIDNGSGCVTPSSQSAQSGDYAPLSRPLYVYVSIKSMARPEVEAFFDYYVHQDGYLAETALFVPLNNQQKAELVAEFVRLTVIS